MLIIQILAVENSKKGTVLNINNEIYNLLLEIFNNNEKDLDDFLINNKISKSNLAKDLLSTNKKVKKLFSSTFVNALKKETDIRALSSPKEYNSICYSAYSKIAEKLGVIKSSENIKNLNEDHIKSLYGYIEEFFIKQSDKDNIKVIKFFKESCTKANLLEILKDKDAITNFTDQLAILTIERYFYLYNTKNDKERLAFIVLHYKIIKEIQIIEITAQTHLVKDTLPVKLNSIKYKDYFDEVKEATTFMTTLNNFRIIEK